MRILIVLFGLISGCGGDDADPPPYVDAGPPQLQFCAGEMPVEHLQWHEWDNGASPIVLRVPGHVGGGSGDPAP